MAGAWVQNPTQQKKKFTTYERDASGRDEAQQRSYSAWHSRFDQPDPYDGSYDLSDPQSLNRYAYTRNDPVNFVDPSGLNLEAPGGRSRPQPLGGLGVFSPGIHSRYVMGRYVDGIRRGQTVVLGRYFVNFGGVGGGEAGVDGGAENVGNGPEEPLPFNNCSEFVNFLVDLVIQYAGHLNDDSAPDQPAVAADRLGTKMANLAFFGYARHANNRAEGFKSRLTRPGGQGAGVYGHILGFAGTYLAGFLYAEIAGYANEFDEFQLLRGDKQGPAEVAGNKAGWAVGRHMWNFISGRTPREKGRLKNSITAELCQ